jgi:hypothetical protein
MDEMPVVMFDGSEASQLDMVLAWYGNHPVLGTLALMLLLSAVVAPFRYMYLTAKIKHIQWHRERHK